MAANRPNPFRRPPPAEATPPPLGSLAAWDRRPEPEERVSSPDDDFEDAEEIQTPPPPKKPHVEKRVRIQTPPPLSPDSPETPNNFPALSSHNPLASFDPYNQNAFDPAATSARPASPPPEANPYVAEAISQDGDPFSKAAEETLAIQGEEVIDNTRRNAEITAGPSINVGATGIELRRTSGDKNGVGIVNPFRRTLASIEPGQQSENAIDRVDGTNIQRSNTMDVDAFTRMLKTGRSHSGSNKEPELPASKLPSSNASLAKVASYSGSAGPTDAELNALSSASSSDDDGDDDDASEPTKSSSSTATSVPDARPATLTRIDSSSSASRKPPPVLPKHRHGKSVNANLNQSHTGPTTVSFSDFSSSVSDDDPLKQQQQPTPVLNERRANKPLPSIPIDSPTKAVRPQTSPPVPSPRQPGHSSTPTALAPGPHSYKTKPPPPPPSRRANTIAPSAPKSQAISTPPTSTSATPGTPSEETASVTSMSDYPATAQPPHSLATALSNPGVGASGRSSRSSSVSEQHARSSFSSGPPPPPPARRRRGSSRSSAEVPFQLSASSSADRRGSGQGIAEEQEGEIAVAKSNSQNALSVAPEVPPRKEPKSKSKTRRDILAEMDALQKDIEALRTGSR